MNVSFVTRRSFMVVLLGAALLPCAWASAASREEELQKSFKARYPKIAALKKAGTVGETHAGYLALVDEKSKDKNAKALVESENQEREELYKLIADKEGVTQEKVAERAGKRAFERAQPGEYLKDDNGRWTQKE